jgi:hypothetical protein
MQEEAKLEFTVTVNWRREVGSMATTQLGTLDRGACRSAEDVGLQLADGELSRSMNKHSLESFFTSLFRMKGDLVSQNRRLSLPELGIRQTAFSVEQPLSSVAGFHTLALVHDLAVTVRLSINEAELFAKRFKSAIRHNYDVHWHVDVTDRIP